MLVAYDGSPPAQRALLHAADLVGEGGKLAVINVIPVQAVSARLETVSDEERGVQENLLREASEALSRQSIAMEPITAVGDPATEILAAAESRNAEMLVVGRSGKHRLRNSLSARLVRSANTDVLVVH